MKEEEKTPVSRFVENLHHFHCLACGGWWTVGDAPEDKQKWFCTWCGKEDSHLVPRKDLNQHDIHE